MRAWSLMLGGLAVWAAHFLVLYGIASTLSGHAAAPWLVGAATLAALAADGLILRKIMRRTAVDTFDRWMLQIAMMGTAISMLAVVWQTAPILFG